MYTLKGFFTHDSLVSNQINVVSRFGELSSNSLSYAKDKQVFTNSEVAPETSLVVFHTVRDGAVITTPLLISNNALSIGGFLLERAQSGQIPTDAYLLRQQLAAEFASSAADIEVGLIIDDYGFKLPEWIRYKDLTTPENNLITIWLADDSFSNQYDEFKIEVVAPIVPLDDFFKDPIQVKTALANYDLVEKTNDVQLKRGEYPFTMIKTFKYDYVNPVVANDYTPSYWIVIIYGQAGNNPDLIREAIVEEVLSGSTHPQDEWAEILPDLFRTTEFIFTPFWIRYSVPNHEFQAGIYSPTINPRQGLPWIQRTARGASYTAPYAAERYELTHNIYKSLSMGVLGNPDNRDGVTQFSDRYPDYMVVSNNNPDFNRMSVITQEFSNILSKLIVAAESMTPFTSVPPGLSRVTRDGVTYATAFYRNINYLVVCKYSAEQLFTV